MLEVEIVVQITRQPFWSLIEVVDRTTISSWSQTTDSEVHHHHHTPHTSARTNELTTARVRPPRA